MNWKGDGERNLNAKKSGEKKRNMCETADRGSDVNAGSAARVSSGIDELG